MLHESRVPRVFLSTKTRGTRATTASASATITKTTQLLYVLRGRRTHNEIDITHPPTGTSMSWQFISRVLMGGFVFIGFPLLLF